MSTTTHNVPAIARGYPYKARLSVRPVAEDEASPFPEGCALLADIALFVGGAAAARLSTADGTIMRIDDNTVELSIPGASTALLTNTTAQLDLVRTDPSPDEWLGLRLQLPVEQPITAARRPS